MDWKRLRSLLLASSRIVGVMLLAGVLLAACGDDDDDDAGDIEATDTTEVATVADDEGTEAEAEDPTPTEAEMTGDGTGTEAEADGSPTSADAEVTGTEEDDTAGTATEDMEADETSTEGESAGTATEADDGTATEADDDGTATEEDEGTATEAVDDDGTATEDESDGTATEADDDSGGTAELGETVDADGFSITVDGAEEFAGMPGLFEADAGNMLVSVTVTIENRDASDEMSVLRTLASIHLETGDGERHDVDLLATAILLINEEGIPEGQIEGGEQVTGKVGFQIPEDADEVILVLESDSGERIEIDLSDEF